MASLNSHSLVCDLIIERKMSLLLFIVFFISYFIFNEVLKEKSTPTQENTFIKQKKAEKYLTQHSNEDIDFFIS